MDLFLYTLLPLTLAAVLLVACVQLARVLLRAKAAYRLASALGALGGLLMLWMSLAVGIFGPEDDLEALMVLAVVSVGAIGALLVRFRARGMAQAVAATAVAQLLFIATSWWMGEVRLLREVFLLNGVYLALFLSSAWLFMSRADDPEPRSGGSPATSTSA